MWVDGQRHAPAAFPPRKRPDTRWTGGWLGSRAEFELVRKTSPPPGSDSRTVQAVACICNDWVNPRETDAPISPVGSFRSTHLCGLKPFATHQKCLMTICSSRYLAAHRTAEIPTVAIWPTSTICYIRCAIFTHGCSNCIQKLQVMKHPSIKCLWNCCFVSKCCVSGTNMSHWCNCKRKC